jgi:hypothetical protein
LPQHLFFLQRTFSLSRTSFPYAPSLFLFSEKVSLGHRFFFLSSEKVSLGHRFFFLSRESLIRFHTLFHLIHTPWVLKCWGFAKKSKYVEIF